MSNTKTPSQTAAAEGAKQTEALTANELDRVVAGAASGTAGGGNVSIWSWMKGQMFGVDPTFY